MFSSGYPQDPLRNEETERNRFIDAFLYNTGNNINFNIYNYVPANRDSPGCQILNQTDRNFVKWWHVKQEDLCSVQIYIADILQP